MFEYSAAILDPVSLHNRDNGVIFVERLKDTEINLQPRCYKSLALSCLQCLQRIRSVYYVYYIDVASAM
jgi:hypothetical protein